MEFSEWSTDTGPTWYALLGQKAVEAGMLNWSITLKSHCKKW